MSADELNELEMRTFYEWRRELNIFQEEKKILMTPYEKNLEFWRQLWRVIERSDIIVQIVDARNPLLFYCQDLTKYVKEVDQNKDNFLLVNKADFLTQEQRLKWKEYFDENCIKAVFFSAIEDSNLEPIIEEKSAMHVSDTIDKNSDVKDPPVPQVICSDHSDDEFYDCGEQFNNESSDMEVESNSTNDQRKNCDEAVSKNMPKNFLNVCNYENNSDILSTDELIKLFSSFKVKGFDVLRKNLFATIGLVGYPNVGKSSTINKIFGEKRVSVSATPGRTKHFQTLFVNESLSLCDCPGLVFPAFVTSKAEMILSGILPVDQMRDHVPPVTLLLNLIPRDVLEFKYGIQIPSPEEGENPDRPPTSEEFLTSYGCMRGFMTSRGTADQPRSARYVLKDYINGNLLYCFAPLNIDQENFHKVVINKPAKTSNLSLNNKLCLPEKKSEKVDASFFNSSSAGFHTKGRKNFKPVALSDGGEIKKPWRLNSKRNTKQKSRIQFRHLDLN